MIAYPIKVVLAVAWLIAAWWLSRRELLRSLAGCVAAIVALVHVCALAGMWIQRHWFRGPAMEGAVVPYIGFVGGIIVGLLLGIAVGWPASRNNLVYWSAHVAAIAFLLLLPLYEW